jgi:flagellin
MTMSVHTNQAALTALQNLNKTSDSLDQVQNRINTGLKINNAEDNASVWAIAQGQRADIGSLNSVTSSLARAKSIADVSMTAGEAVSDLLVQLQQQVTDAMDISLTTTARDEINANFQALLKQISQTTSNAEFDGANLLDGSQASNLQFLANADADSYITLSNQNLSLGGSIISIHATASLGSASQATAMLALVTTSLTKTDEAMGNLGSQAKQVDAHATFVSKLIDTLTTGVGNLVDADLARESANLQALQVQQQLGAQALSIANSAPQIILQLFK